MAFMKWLNELVGASSLRRRIIVMGLASAIVPVLCLMFMTVIQKKQISTHLKEDFTKIEKEQLASIVKQIYTYCENQHKMLDSDDYSAEELNHEMLEKKERSDLGNLRSLVISSRLGESGYAFVLGASGIHKGRYLISKDGLRDGESIWNSIDANGKFFVQDMINKATTLNEGEVYFMRYNWKNPGESKARAKMAAIMYFKPLNWVLGISAYEDEYFASIARTENDMNRLVWIIILSGLAALGFSAFLAVKVGKGVIKPVEKLMQVTDKLALGDVNVELDIESRDEIGRLASSMESLVNNVKSQVNVAQEIANGNLNIDVKIASDADVLAKSMNQVRDTLLALENEAEMLTNAAVEGRLEVRGNVNAFKGGYSRIIQGVNNTLDALVGPLKMAANYFERISNGDIPEEISDNYKGEFEDIKNSLNRCLRTLQAMGQDVRTICTAALQGNLETRVDSTKHQGIYQKIVQGFNDIMNSLCNPINEAIEVIEKLANNDLTGRMVGDYMGDHAKIKECLNRALDTLEGTIIQVSDATNQVNNASQALTDASDYVGNASQQIAETSSQMAEGSLQQSKFASDSLDSMQQLSTAIQEVAQGAQSQARAVDQTVALIQQISSAIEQVAASTQESAKISDQVSQVAKEGGRQVEDAVASMNKIKEATEQVADVVLHLGESSKQIGAIVETIDDIAEQTNLLALNAAIEAARAGEHGKGFAVVADEVRKLAERSSKATGEIAELINNIQHMTEQAVQSMERGSKEVEEGTALGNQAGEALSRIQEAIEMVVKQSQDVAAAAQQMSGASTEIVRAIENVSAITEETTAAAEEMSASSVEVTQQIEQVAAVCQQNSAAAEEVSSNTKMTTAAAEEMAQAARQLADMAGNLQELVNQFNVNYQKTLKAAA